MQQVWLSYNGTDRRNGIPFTLLLRDILEFDTSVSEALDRIEKAKRTCSIWVGLGSPTSPQKFTVVELRPCFLFLFFFFSEKDRKILKGHCSAFQ